ncbi:MAG TPA: Hsp20/alpha crystallin family protein [Myxococcales bacterium]|nr:Hsp20/alpha crystallin family protein [Myxococcales bacterium]
MWDPFQMLKELTSWDPLERFERSFAPLSGRRGFAQTFAPTFDVRETGESYVFTADLPGMKEEDLDLSLTGNRLTISGSRQAEEKKEGETYHSIERSYGSFSRTFTIPEGCDLDNVSADLKHGVLTLTVPKKESVKPRRISLKGLKGGVENLKEKVSEKLKS